MENVLFKISYPAEFHAQTAVEAAMQLHPAVRDRLDEIETVLIETQEPGVRIIDKTGPLANPADRDHCLQYMTAVPLIFGRLTADGLRRRRRGRPADRRAAGEDAGDARTPRSRATTTISTSDTSATRCRCVQGRHAHRARRSRASRSAIASAAPRACRCWSRNSARASRRSCRRAQFAALDALCQRRRSGWRRRRSTSSCRCCVSALVDFGFPLLDRPRPVVLEQPRQRAVGEQLAARLAAGAVVRFVVGVANPLHRRAAHGARLAEATVDGHLGVKGGHLFGKAVARLLAQPVDPRCERVAASPRTGARSRRRSSRLVSVHRRQPRRVQNLVAVRVADAAEQPRRRRGCA